MDIQRIYLADGAASAMAHHRPSHGQLKAIFKAARANAKAERPEESLADTLLILCTSWEVKDEEGNDLPFNKAGIDAADGHLIQELSDKLEAITRRDDPLSDRLLWLANLVGEDHPFHSKLIDLAAEAVVKPETVAGN